MKRYVLLRLKLRQQLHFQAGFTITEMIAGLLLAAVLLTGLIDITRRYAHSTGRVKEVAAKLRSDRLLHAALREAERADTGTLVATASSLSAKVGSNDFEAVLRRGGDGSHVLAIVSGASKQTFPVPRSTRFEKTPSGLVVLRSGENGAVLAVIDQKRTAPYDCQFDTVIGECR